MSELLNFLTLDNLKQTTGLMIESPSLISRRIKMPFRWLWGSGRYKAIWKVRLMLDSDYESRVMRSDSSRHVLTQLKAVADPWQEPGGPAASLLIFRPNSGPKGRKKFFGDRVPRLSQGLDDPGPPSYVKVWIRQCQRHFEFHADEQIKHLQIQLAWFLVLVLSFGAGEE